MEPEPSVESSLRVFSLTKDVAVATFRSVVFCQFRGETTASSAAIVRRAITSLARPPKTIFFAVIETSSPPPNDEARKAFTKMFEDQVESLAAAVIVIRGEGFRAAMVRVISAGILSLGLRVRFPKHIGSSLEEAAHLALQYAPDLDAASLVRAFRQLERMTP